VIGVIALLYAAISMLVEVERAFNQIYCVPVGRSWLRRFVNYWALLTLGAAGLFATFYVGQRVTSELSSLAGGDQANAILLGIIGFASTAFISTMLFLMLYLVIPNTRVSIGPALAGAFVSALLWEGGKWGFTQYLRYSTGYARLYGSIALVPLFLLWVYCTWCIVLSGLNIAYYVQHGRRKTVARPVEQLNPGVVDPGCAVALAVTLARRFDSGEPADAASLARALGLQDAIVLQMLDRMVAAGMALRVKHKDEEGYFALACPASRVNAEEALKIGEDLISQPPEGAVSVAMRVARHDAVRGKTVAEFADTPRAAAATGASPALAGRARA